MSFIVVKYGYKHKMLFSTNVTFAPLIDSMRDGVCKSLNDILTNKEAEFNKKLKELNTAITNDKNAKDKLLHKDGKPENPDLPETKEDEDDKKEAKGPGAKKETKKEAKGKDAKGKDAKKEDKKEAKKEEKKEAKKEEKKEAKKEEKKEAKKEEKKEVKKDEKKEEKKEVKKDAKKETKKEGKKDSKKDGKGKDAKKGETDEENKLEEDVAKKIEEIDERITKNEADCELVKQKIKAIKEAVQRFKSQEVYPKVIDLVDSNGERKYIKTKKDIYANTYLTDKSGYDIVEVITNPDGKDNLKVLGGDQAEEEVKKIEIDGMCVRSIEEEKAFVPEEKVPDKGKGGKGGKDAKGKDAKGKKK